MYEIDLNNRNVYRDGQLLELPELITNRHWELVGVLAKKPDGTILKFNYFENVFIKYGKEAVVRYIREFLHAIGNWEDRQKIFQIIRGEGYRINKDGLFCIVDKSEELPLPEEKTIPSHNSPLPMDAKLQYYSVIWNKFRKPEFRDEDRSQNLEFFDSYIQMLPSEAGDEKRYFQGFTTGGRNLILSPSGLGKTYLLQCLSLLQVYGYLKEKNSPALSKRALENDSYIKQLQEAFWHRASYFPIHISCGDIHEKGKYSNLLQLAAGYSDEFADAFSSLVKTAAENNALLLMIDSVDEIIDEDAKKSFFNHLSSFLSDHSTTTVIMTSRFVELSSQLDQYKKFELKPFGIDEISSLAHKLLTSAEDKPDAVVEMIKNNPYLVEIAANPFMATTIFTMHTTWNAGLYPVPCLHVISDRIIHRRWQVSDNREINTIKQILGYLAWDMLLHQPENSIGQDELYNVVINARSKLFRTPEEGKLHLPDDKVDRFAKLIMNSSGILNLQENGYKREFVFQSNVLLYYFAAAYLVKCIIDKNVGEKARLFENLYTFFDQVIMEAKEKVYTHAILQTLAITTVFDHSNAFPYWKQQIPLLCILGIGMSAKDDKEHALVAHTLAEIVNNVYNTNAVTNSDDQQICSMLHLYFDQLSESTKNDCSIAQCIKKLKVTIDRSNLFASVRL